MYGMMKKAYYNISSKIVHGELPSVDMPSTFTYLVKGPIDVEPLIRRDIKTRAEEESIC
jgi:hypothetical protein